MRYILALAVVFMTPQVAAADRPPEMTIRLSNFKFDPARIELPANRPSILILRNDSRIGHSFAAPAFFAGAHLDAASAALVHNGTVEVAGHSSLRLSVIPQSGQYPLRCSHTLHGAFGMKGLIKVI